MQRERQGRPGLGKVRGGLGSSTPPISLNLHKRETQNAQSLPNEGGARPCWGRTEGAAASSRLREGEREVRRGRGAGDQRGR